MAAAAAKGGAGPRAAAGVAMAKGGGRISAAKGGGRISAAELRARVRQQERRPRAARSAAARVATATRRGSGPERRQQDACFYFFVCQKCFGTGWSFQPIPMDV